MIKTTGRGKIRGFSLTLTERCNWRCRYCYQRRGTKVLDGKIVDEACDAIFPFLSASPSIQFYGGEPLLSFGLVRRAVERLEKKNRNCRKRLRYVLTTNGSLLDSEILSFLNEYRFDLMLSFDGLAQEEERKKGSFRVLSSLLDALPRYPDVRPAVNSVFTPRTVEHLAPSVAWLAERNIPDILASFDVTVPWTSAALERLARGLRSSGEILLRFARAGRPVPLVNFRRPAAPGIFGCTAGQDRLALAPDGRIWGCFLYVDFFRAHPTPAVVRRFCFGTIADFVRKNGALDPEIVANYAAGRMDWMETRERACGNCRRLDLCAICPPAAALGRGRIGGIPVALCRINRILLRERDLFWKRVGIKGT
ncbi:MAG: radical SAM protein [Candidatus Aminicenantales bacterium]